MPKNGHSSPMKNCEGCGQKPLNDVQTTAYCYFCPKSAKTPKIRHFCLFLQNTMPKIDYNISLENPIGGDSPFRVKDITVSLVMPDGEELKICLHNTQNRMVELKTKMYGHFSIPLADIVMVCPSVKSSETGLGNTKNKSIYFANRRPDIICKFTPGRDIKEKWGVTGNEFVCVNRSVYINRNHILAIANHYVTVQYMNDAGTMQKSDIPVSRTCWHNLINNL